MLSLGSNKGDSLDILRQAVTSLSGILLDLKVSSVYKTVPQGPVQQNDFLNCVVTGTYTDNPVALLQQVHEVESVFGRDRFHEIPKGPRTLDIDIILFGSLILSSHTLTIPHESMHERQFVLIPLLELLPDCADPVTGQPFRTVSARLGDQGVQKAGSLYGS